MKSNKWILAVVAALVCLSSCTMGDDVMDEGSTKKQVELTFNVGSSAATTRAYTDVRDKVPTMTWETDDEISVFSDNDWNTNQLFNQPKIDEELDNYATFKGHSTPAKNMYYILYPYQEGATCKAGTLTSNGVTSECGIITATIPSKQTARLNSYDPQAMLQTGAAGTTNNQDVDLKNTCAFLYITLPEGVDNVLVEPKDGSDFKLTGQVEITTTSGMSAIANAGAFVGGVSHVQLVNVNRVAGTYVMCIAPAEAYPGLTVTVTFKDADGNTIGTKVQSTSSNSIQLAGGFFYNLGTVDALD